MAPFPFLQLEALEIFLCYLLWEHGQTPEDKSHNTGEVPCDEVPLECLPLGPIYTEPPSIPQFQHWFLLWFPLGLRQVRCDVLYFRLPFGDLASIRNKVALPKIL